VAKTYYELLDVQPSASSDEIKRAFRREIAKYHPDKVQHLGEEFQEIAATKAAELTRAYKTLTDPASRADYDATGEPAAGAPSPRPPSPPPASPSPSGEASGSQAAPATEPSGSSSVFSQERAGANDLVRRATVMRFRNALNGEFGQWDDIGLAGFEVACLPKPAFWSLKLAPRVLGRFVAQVDGPAVTETWTMATRIPKDTQRAFCVVFLMGPAIAPASELAAAIIEQGRKPWPAGGKMIMVPVNTRTWSAHIPNDAPPVVKSMLTRLKAK
jgi:curved DNA-binding protein CbpA